jgi:membrane protein DedA with SNARE-associated domain
LIHNLVVAAHLAAGDVSLATKLMSLLVLPFAHEDLAIILGGYIIVNNMMPPGLVAIALYGGIVISDLALYGVGFGARRLPWLHRFTIDGRVRRFSETLKRNVFGLVALCRLVPGIVFVAFIACGWMRVSFWRFAIASVVVSALYLPLMLYLVITFGESMDDNMGLWTWPALFVVLAAAGYVRKRVLNVPDVAVDAGEAGVVVSPCPGMPAVAMQDRKVSAAERIPPALFYLPLVLNWLWLGIRHRSVTLPTAANPNIFCGGMWGETKSSYLLDVGADERCWVAPFALARRNAGAATLAADLAQALHAMQSAGLAFPLIAKPDIGWHGYGVQVIDDTAALEAYMAEFPAGATIMLQRLVEHPAEAAVLYARMPGDARGRVFSLTFRYFPHVVGDGRATLRELIEKDDRARWKGMLHLGRDGTHCGPTKGDLARIPDAGEVVRIALIGNQRAGALYRDGGSCITAALDARFDGIAASMREFHYGRFDIRFESVPALMRGESFSIVEINGIGGEAIDVWDARLPVREVYARLFAQQRLLFEIGAANRARGRTPVRAVEFVASLVRQSRLIGRYPASR